MEERDDFSDKDVVRMIKWTQRFIFAWLGLLFVGAVVVLGVVVYAAWRLL